MTITYFRCHECPVKTGATSQHFTGQVTIELNEQFLRNACAMKWPDGLKESPSQDSFKEKYLRVLGVSSAAGGEKDQII